MMPEIEEIIDDKEMEGGGCEGEKEVFFRARNMDYAFDNLR